MPFICTHFYTAARVALSFVRDETLEEKLSNKNFLMIRDIGNGFLSWLSANKAFQEGANAAIAANNGDMMQKVMDQYRNTLYNTESIAIFSAFAAGSQGPDLWACPRKTKVINVFKLEAVVHGDNYFDLGHYNRSHAYPTYALGRIFQNRDTLPLLQYKYQAAYTLGFLTHIALDIHSHLKVNVFAGGYFQQRKTWETEQTSSLLEGSLPLEGFKSPFNNHNKIEQYFDSLIRFLCFEGCYPEIEIFKSLRSDILQQKEIWNFPNYDNYWSKRLKFGKIIHTNGIFNADEDFLNLSTSLAGPFAFHFRPESSFRVTPFIRDDMYNAYENVESFIKTNLRSFAEIPDEKDQMTFFAMDNTKGMGGSNYYNLRIVSPNIERVAAFTPRFYNATAFCEFIRGSISLARTFVTTGLKFLEDGDAEHLHHLKNWNLDIGLAIRIRKPKEEGVPSSPVRIDLINTLGYPDIRSWMRSDLDYQWQQKNADNPWPVPTPKAPQNQPRFKLTVGSGKSYNIKLEPQVALRINMTHNRFYSQAETDEIGAFLFADSERSGEPWVIQEPSNIGDPDAKKGYHIDTCLEDFKTEFAETSERTVGNSRLKDFSSLFYGYNKAAEPASSDGTDRRYPQFRQLPRHVRFTLCRKWIMEDHDTGGHGQFDPDLLRIHNTLYPSEELVMSIFAVFAKEETYYDLFHDVTFTKDQIDSLLKVKVIGINTVVLIFISGDNGVLQLNKAYIDGEAQDLTKDEADDYPSDDAVKPEDPDIPEPEDNSCYCLKMEDILFRTDSAVFLPNGYGDRTSFNVGQEQAEGLAAVAALYKHAAMFPKHKLIITAHTDTVGSAQFNFDLSNDRGASVLAILEGNREAWADVAMKRSHKKDIQTICKWFNDKYSWTCDPGTIDGVHGTKTEAAIKSLKTRYNNTPEFNRTIPETSRLDKDTWAMIFDLYQREIAGLIDTTYDKMREKFDSWKERWVDGGRKAIGCSEAFPKDQPGRNDYESAVNRRIEVFFFGNKLLESKGELCSASQSASTPGSAKDRVDKCRGECKIFSGMPEPEYIKV